MAKAKRFEDLECWSLAIKLDSDVFQFTSDSEVMKYFSLRDQMLRSVGSIADNIAEGFERGGNKEFIQYLYIAKASCGELRTQFYRCKNRGIISEAEFEKHHRQCTAISVKISNLITYLKSSSFRGNKFT
jgi:four helix bundle protein